MNLRTITCFLLLLISSSDVFAGQPTFVSVGFKIGYPLDRLPGLTVGLECSLNWINNYSYGIVLDVDRRSSTGLIKYHLGAEFTGYYGIGLEWGPTVISDSSHFSLGHSLTPYFGFIFMPYYTFTFSQRYETMNEFGTYLKFPAPISGVDFNQ